MIDTKDPRVAESGNKAHILAVEESKYEGVTDGSQDDLLKYAVLYLLAKNHDNADPKEKLRVRNHIASLFPEFTDDQKKNLAGVGERVNRPVDEAAFPWKVVTGPDLAQYPEMVPYFKVGDSAQVPPTGKFKDLKAKPPENLIEVLNNERAMVAPGSPLDLKPGQTAEQAAKEANSVFGITAPLLPKVGQAPPDVPKA